MRRSGQVRGEIAEVGGKDGSDVYGGVLFLQQKGEGMGVMKSAGKVVQVYGATLGAGLTVQVWGLDCHLSLARRRTKVETLLFRGFCTSTALNI